MSKKVPTSDGAEWLINEGSLLEFIEKRPQITIAPATQAAQTKPSSDASDAKPPIPSDAKQDVSDAEDDEPIGERRKISDLLIDNARLLATIDGIKDGRDRELTRADQTIAELKDDRKFLRDELTEARKLRSDVKELSEKMLDTIGDGNTAAAEARALRLLLEQKNTPNSVAAEIITPEGEVHPAQ